MQTNVLLLLVFSLISVLIYYIISPLLRRYYLLCLNLLFYLLCDYKFFLLMFATILFSFKIGKKISYTAEKSNRNFLLLIGIVPLITILAIFKYFNFFIQEFSAFFHFDSNTSLFTLAMPLGISYYLFKAISYLFDVYKQKRLPEACWLNYAIYISFFPQIICGPIVRSEELTRQLYSKLHFNKALFYQGYLLIISGLFKKLVIADRLSNYVNTIFSNPSSYPSLALWMGAFLYTIQIYCDFAGYSEIVIGITNLFGIECSKNFNLPYFSSSLQDFWKRWHISLSSWLRDYIYIPLGGNKISKLRTKINTLVTFLVSGLWHGNSVNYLVWGLWHGLLNLLPHRLSSNKLLRFFHTVATFFAVMFGWIFFRSQTLQGSLLYIQYMFTGFTVNYNSILASVMPFSGDYSCLAYLLTVLLFIIILFIIELREHCGFIKNVARENTILNFIYLIAVILFSTIGQNSFLYANF